MAAYGAMRNMTIGGRGFKVSHDGSGSKQIGGSSNELQMNGDGSFRTIRSVVPGSISDVNVELNDSNGDLEYLQGLATDGTETVVVATYASNISYTGSLVIIGEVQKDEMTGLATLSFQGSQLTKM